jgi:hypothetical protein
VRHCLQRYIAVKFIGLQLLQVEGESNGVGNPFFRIKSLIIIAKYFAINKWQIHIESGMDNGYFYAGIKQKPAAVIIFAPRIAVGANICK